jgi:hypothetical protein
VIGWIIALTDPRIGLAVGGASCFAAAIGGAGLARRFRRAEALKTVQPESPASAGPLAAKTPVGSGRTVGSYALPSGTTASCVAAPPTGSPHISSARGLLYLAAVPISGHDQEHRQGQSNSRLGSDQG